MIDRSLRHVLVVLLGCFAILFVQLNRVQVFNNTELRENPANTRTIQRDFSRPRGLISTADRVVIARSVPSDGPFSFQREYPEGELFGHITGYLSINIGASGVERTYNDELVGRTPSLQLSGLADLLGDSDATGQVIVSLRRDLQAAARDALGERRGSVVALDPRTGEILAMWSNPSYDPNLLASQDGEAVNAAYADLLADEANPLRASAYRDIFFPGSTFKLVTASAALEANVVTLTSPVFDVETSYTPPLTSRSISNFGGSSCGGDLLALITSSCNVGFARLGAELVGPSRMVDQAQAYGFNTVPPIDLPGAAASQFPTDYGEQVRSPSLEIPAGVYENSPALAQAAIGQFDVAATPLQMALVVAGIVNNGQIMAPRVVSEIRNKKGDVVDQLGPTVWQRPISELVAADLQTAMVNVVENGTGRSIQFPGLLTGAKTGTAQLGTVPALSHAWMVAFAGPVDGDPELVLAVLVEANETDPEQTGGRVAGPVVASMIETYFANS